MKTAWRPLEVIFFDWHPKRRLVLVLLGAALLSGLMWTLLHSHPAESEPVYHGKTLSAWLVVYDPANTNRPASQLLETETAEAPYALTLSGFPSGRKLKELSDARADVRNKAVWSLGDSGEEARHAIPALLKTLDDADRSSVYSFTWTTLAGGNPLNQVADALL